MTKDIPCIVADIGTGYIKAGLALDDMETNVIPSLLARQQNSSSVEHYTAEAARRTSHMDISRPISDGIVINKEDYTLLMRHIFSKELKIEVENFSFLGSRNPDETMKSQADNIELYFEEFKVQAYSTIDRALLTLYGSGMHSGMVVDCGEHSTRVSAIVNGTNHLHEMKTLDYGAGQLTKDIMQILNNNGAKADLEMARLVKEGKCYASNTYEESLAKFKSGELQEKSFELPDGQFIKLKEEQFTQVEKYFQPYLYGSFTPGIHFLIDEVIADFDLASKRSLYNHLCIAGGGAEIANFEARVLEEAGKLTPRSFSYSVQEADKRQNLGWLGGSIACSLSSFKGHWIEKEDYEEYGSEICYRKCL